MHRKHLMDVTNYLHLIYGDDIEIDEEELSNGTLKGFLRDKPFEIVYVKDQYLILNINEKNTELLNEFISKLSIIMKNKPPICKYRFLRESMTSDDEAAPIVEWDIIDPLDRIKKIVNFNDNSTLNKCLDIEVYERGQFTNDIDKYNESSIEKKFGVYMGSIKTFEAQYFNCPAKLFLIIEYLHSKMKNQELEAKQNGLLADTIENDYAIDYCIYQTKKFGVELPNPSANKRMIQTDSYLKWYNFHVDHFKAFTQKEWTELKSLIAKNGDISQYLPIYDWQESNKTLIKTYNESKPLN